MIKSTGVLSSCAETSYQMNVMRYVVQLVDELRRWEAQLRPNFLEKLLETVQQKEDWKTKCAQGLERWNTEQRWNIVERERERERERGEKSLISSTQVAQAKA